MRISYLNIDDFYDDPHAVRNAALHTDYARAVDGANYPGDNSAEVFEVQGLNELVSNLVKEPVMGTPGTGHCRFRIATAGAEEHALARMHVEARASRGKQARGATELPVPALRKLTDTLIETPHDERLAMRGMRRGRVDLLPTGGIILTTLARELGSQNLERDEPVRVRLLGEVAWLLRRHEEEVATIDAARVMHTNEPVPIAAVLMAFTLIDHGIPGEAKLMPSQQ